jgi:hypothetical protein
MLNAIAFELHQVWRKTRLREDGTYKPRWKNIMDESFKISDEMPKYIRKIKDGKYQIDIANAYYTQLSRDWKNEKINAAKVVVKILEMDEILSDDEIGDIIHNEWIKRNSWAKYGKLGVPYSQLPKNEQNKDLAQFRIGEKMYNAEFVDIKPQYLDEAVRFLKHAKILGKSMKIKYAGQFLFSDFDDSCTAYNKIFYGSKREINKTLKKVNKIENPKNDKSKNDTQQL